MPHLWKHSRIETLSNLICMKISLFIAVGLNGMPFNCPLQFKTFCDSKILWLWSRYPRCSPPSTGIFPEGLQPSERTCEDQGNHVKRKEKQRGRGHPHHSYIVHVGVDRALGTTKWGWAWKNDDVKVMFYFCFSLSYTTTYNKWNQFFFPERGSFCPCGRQSSSLYLNTQTFILFSPTVLWGWWVREEPRGHLTASQGQPTTMIKAKERKKGLPRTRMFVFSDFFFLALFFSWAQN